MELDYAYGESANKIKFGRIDFFKASGEFVTVFQEMQKMLEAYAKLPASKAKEIKERNERIEKLVNFYNSSHELLEMFEDWYENAFREHPRELHEYLAEQCINMMNYAQKQTKEALDAQNYDRVRICMDLFLKASDISLYFGYLGNVRAEQPITEVDKADGLIRKAIPKADWMEEGSVIYRERMRLVERKGYKTTVKKEEMAGIVKKVDYFEVVDPRSKSREMMVYNLEIEWERNT